MESTTVVLFNNRVSHHGNMQTIGKLKTSYRSFEVDDDRL